MTDTTEKTVTPDHELMLVDDRGDWAIVTINRPEKRNAMNQAIQRRFREALAEVIEKKVVVLTGVGPSFCAGVDLVEGRGQPPAPGRHPSQNVASWNQCQEVLRAHPAIFIAAVNGFALGGGSTLVNNCELAIAAESAAIGTPEMGFGTWPGLAGPAMIKRVLPKHSAEIIFNAKRVDGKTAYRMGMVNECVPDDQLMPTAIAMAEHIAEFDATLLDYGKKGYHKMLALDWDDALDYSGYVSNGVSAHRPAPIDGLAGFADGVRRSGQGA